jgi:antimicrobial peptide system SdpB family protein
MLSGVGQRALRWSLEESPFTPVLGAARTLLALCTAATLLTNGTSSLFVPTVEHPSALMCEGLRGFGLFCALSREHLELGRWLCILLLLGVATGYRPRLTGILHWYVAFSFQANATVLDGGDQLAAVLCLLLLPLTILDGRRWHWDEPPASTAPEGGWWRSFERYFARVSLTATRVQMAVVYFLAAIGKLEVDEWINGTALYYWFGDRTIGAAGWADPLTHWLFERPAALALLTWSVLLLEFGLAAAIFMKREHQRSIFYAGLALHLGVLVIHGISSLSLTMIGGLLIYLWRTPLTADTAPPLAIPAANPSRLPDRAYIA